MDNVKCTFTWLAQLIQCIRIDGLLLFIVFGTRQAASAVLLLFCCVYFSLQYPRPPTGRRRSTDWEFLCPTELIAVHSFVRFFPPAASSALSGLFITITVYHFVTVVCIDSCRNIVCLALDLSL